MSNGTTVRIYATRIHRHNAREIVAEAERSIGNARERLLILAAMTPTTTDNGDGPISWPDYIQSEVESCAEVIEEQSVRRLLAQQILDYPAECEDELDRVDLEMEKVNQRLTTQEEK